MEQVLDDETGQIYLVRDFDFDRSSDVKSLIDPALMSQERIRIFGKEYLQPRLIRFEGDPGIAYTYSKQKYMASEWSAFSLEIRSKLKGFTAHDFNSVLINLYRNGQDSMGLHADNEPELGSAPTIASVSYGAEREIWFKENNGHRKIKLQLEHGSLLIMSGNLQNNWKHEIRKSRKVFASRLNFTFRKIY